MLPVHNKLPQTVIQNRPIYRLTDSMGQKFSMIQLDSQPWVPGRSESSSNLCFYYPSPSFPLSLLSLLSQPAMSFLAVMHLRSTLFLMSFLGCPKLLVILKGTNQIPRCCSFLYPYSSLPSFTNLSYCCFSFVPPGYITVTWWGIRGFPIRHNPLVLFFFLYSKLIPHSNW